MRIIIEASGDIIIDADGTNPVAVADLIRRLQEPADQPYTGPLASPDMTVLDVAHIPPETIAQTSHAADLSLTLQETWEWIIANDYEEGITPYDVAVAFDINGPAAGMRLRQLADRGVIHRITRGHYRAGKG